MHLGIDIKENVLGKISMMQVTVRNLNKKSNQSGKKRQRKQ